MPTQPIDLAFPGGFLRTVSRTAARGRIISGDKVRFQAGKWEKIGGWVKLVSTALTGIARGSFGWTAQAGDDLIATGTQTKLYSISDTLQDITPLRKTTNPLGNNPLTMVNASPTVTVHDVAHGATDGATVGISGAAASHGLTISGNYVLTYVDADNYTITASGNATSAGTGGGAAVVAAYEINPGLSDSSFGLGYGSGLYGRGTYGTPRSASNGLSGGVGILNELRTWFFANYGNELAVLPSGGTVYLWDQNASAARAVAVTNAPSSARAMFITPERMIVALGTTLPMTMQWCDRLDTTNWTASITSTANTRTLQVGNKLVAGAVFTGGISLFWSDTAIYLMQFLGSTGEIYSTRVVGEGCGLVGPCAFTRTAMTHSENPLGRVYMIGADSYVYEHEVGNDANGAALAWEMQSGPVALGNGIGDIDIIGFVPDFERAVKDISLQIRTFERPMSVDPIEDATHTIAEGDILVDMKHGGRYADLKLSGDAIGSDFRLGIPQIEVGLVSERR